MTSFNLDAVLTGMLATADAISDCLFIVGRAPQVEIYGKLRSVEVPGLGLLTAEHTEAIAADILAGNGRLEHDFHSLGSCDTSYALGTLARFRVNVFRQNGNHAVVMRRLPTQIPTIDGLKLPPVFKQIVKEKNGLVFVTGATGNGKTTTLAAMLNELNHTEELHIVTLEDPIEFLHPHRRSTFSQRELGRDFLDFATGARAAMRQAPKVILVGEIRDRETMEVALTAAETGHVVYATLHTISASLTINRVLGFFARTEEDQVRQRLADVLRYTVSQRLIPRINGGRHLVTECMGTNLRVREAVMMGESEIRDIHEIIESNSPAGWHTFEQSLLTAYKLGKITAEIAMGYSVNKNAMGRDLDQARKEMFPVEDMETGLRLDRTALHVPGGSTPLPR
ncbi:MAG: PilT/PilU family type 4a pilus ATPase [Chthoniobacteraceae bacterium]|nr:PilT/PilU family type 4a pilus ATPase [Chthoniobacteraceae bacterium]